MMTLDPSACYRAITARDERFDGVFFVAVKTTGVYCRPICPARTPGRDRCTFYPTAAQAERAGYRACLRCRPELAPGSAPIDSLSRIVRSALVHIDAGALNEGSLDQLAQGLGVTARHLRRAMQSELGVSPSELAQTRRLALAKRLVHDTAMSLTDVAFASGFQSVRRFNASFRERYGRAPSQLRRARGSDAARLRLRLDYRPPYDWPAMLEFLGARAIPGVEVVREGVYSRTVQLAGQRGVISVAPLPDRAALSALVSPSLAAVLMPLVVRLRRLFDLDAQPSVIAEQLSRDPFLAPHVATRPGLRVPGAFDPFEAAMRAILGQQVSVRAATTLAGRLATAYGESLETADPELTRTAPTAERIASCSAGALTAHGILASRAHSLRALAHALLAGSLRLEPSADPEPALEQLRALPGIGEWTAQYIALRALSWPDAYPDADLGVRKALGGLRARDARERAEAWRPWRAYAVMHLWASLSAG